MLGRTAMFVATLLAATLVSFDAVGATPYSDAGLACTLAAVTTASHRGHIPAKGQYRNLAKTATNATVRSVAKRLANDPWDADALSDFGEWCKDRYPKFKPIQQSDFEYD